LTKVFKIAIIRYYGPTVWATSSFFQKGDCYDRSHGIEKETPGFGRGVQKEEKKNRKKTIKKRNSENSQTNS